MLNAIGSNSESNPSRRICNLRALPPSYVAANLPYRRAYYSHTFLSKESMRHRPLSVVVTTLLSAQKVNGSIPGSIESDLVSPMAHHRCVVFEELCCPGAKVFLLVTRVGVISRVHCRFNFKYLGRFHPIHLSQKIVAIY